MWVSVGEYSCNSQTSEVVTACLCDLKDGCVSHFSAVSLWDNDIS